MQHVYPPRVRTRPKNEKLEMVIERQGGLFEQRHLAHARMPLIVGVAERRKRAYDFWFFG